MRFSTEAVPLLTTRERLRALESFFLVVRVFGRSTVLLNFRVVKGASQRKHLKEMSSLTGLQITLKVLHPPHAAAAGKSLQSCPTLCDPIDGSPPGSPVPGILQAKNTGVGCHFLLQCMKVKSESEVAQLCLTLATPWTAAYQAPQSMGFSRQKYWSGVPLPSPHPLHLGVLLCPFPR